MTYYTSLFEAYRKCYCGEFSKEKIQNNVNSIWRSLKANKSSFPANAQEKITELLQNKTKKDAVRLSFFTRQTISRSRNAVNAESENSTATSPKNSVLPTTNQNDSSATSQLPNVYETEISPSENSTDNSAVNSLNTTRTYATPVQDAIKAKIVFLEKQLCAAVEGRDSGLAVSGIQKEINKLRKDIETAKKLLQSKEGKTKRQKKYRRERQNTLKVIKQEHPDLAKALKVREEPGRPRLEDDQPELLKTIANIAMFGGAADERRRSELIRSCKNLHELQKELEVQGFNISRSATYLRLLPRNSHTAEGKRHVKTVPVKLCRAQADARKTHRDGKFCTASIRSVGQLISTLGPDQVAVISQDDKSRVPIGLTAANKQAPMLMHLEYKVRLPDHDWVVAPRHKLIPSVYAGIYIKDGKIGDPNVVTYSGPTYIAIRSGKHCSSTASSHAFDFQRLLRLESFKDLFYCKDGQQIKPVVVIMSDGGPDENPRYQKVIAHAVDHFRTYNLDALFLITNAPGRSAYNRVERRMAPLSQELAGLILPHNHFGTHLNDSGITIDKDLELQNFAFAGETLAEIWNMVLIDDYSVNAEYVGAESMVAEPNSISPEWYSLHVQESQYFLQIAKCANRDCCGDWRSNLRDILPVSNGFLPPPFPLRRTGEGLLMIPSPKDTEEKDSFPDLFFRQSIGLKPFTSTGFSVPYDFYCPSVRDEIETRTCDLCGTYFATQKQKNIHIKALHNEKPHRVKKFRANKVFARRQTEVLCDIGMLEPTIEWKEEEEIDENVSLSIDEYEDRIPLIDDLQEWLTSPFERMDGL